MRGIVSLLDQESTDFVRGLWAAIANEFGPGASPPGFVPHVSLHVAEDYKLEETEARVRSLALSIPPLETVTTGVGVFTGDEHIVYLPVVRTPRLTVLQRAVVAEAAVFATQPIDVFDPDRWVPHITLGRWDAAADTAANVVRFLLDKAHTRPLALDNLALLADEGEGHATLFRHQLES